MARKEIKIKVVSYVHVGDQLVNTEDLDPEQKRKLATWLKCTYLNALYEGKAKFWPVEEDDKEKCLPEKKGQPTAAGHKKSPGGLEAPPGGGKQNCLP